MRVGTTTAAAVTEAALAAIARVDPHLSSFTAVTAERARAEARDDRRAASGRRGAAAARRRSVRGQEPVRRRGPAHARGRARPSRPAARDRGRHARGADARRGRDPRRRAQHGRVRLRLHHREHALRPDPQSARPGAHGRRLVGRFRRGGGRAARAAVAGLRHQRLHSRAVVAVRHLGLEADVRAALAPRRVSVRREPRPRRPAGGVAARPCRVLRRAAGRGPRRSGLRAAFARARAPRRDAGRARTANRASRRLFRCACERRCARRGRSGLPCARRARAASNCRTRRWAARRRSSITGSEGGALHLPELRERRADLEPLSRDRFLAGALRARRVVRAGAARARVVPRARARAVRRRRRAARAGDTVRGDAARHRMARPQRRARAAPREHGPADAAHLLHRPAGDRGADGGSGCAADRRADHCGTVARGLMLSRRRRARRRPASPVRHLPPIHA